MTTVLVVTYDHPQYGQGLQGVFTAREAAEKAIVEVNKVEGIAMSQYENPTGEWIDDTTQFFYHDKFGITYTIYAAEVKHG